MALKNLELRRDAATFTFARGAIGVSENFKMIVPVYIEFENGNVTRLGSAAIKGSSSLKQTIPAGKPPSPIKCLMINYNYDVLSVEK